MINLLFMFSLALFDSSALAMTSRSLWLPQSQTLNSMDSRFDMQMTFAPLKSSEDGAAVYGQSHWGMAVGAFERGPVALEVSLDWVEPTIQESVSALSAGLRVRALKLDEQGFSVAAGIDRFGFKPRVSDVNVIYGLIETRFTDLWRGLIGGYAGNSVLLVNAANRDDSRGVFLGLWKKFENQKGEWAFEYQSGYNRLGYLFVGAQLQLRDDVRGFTGFGLSSNRTTQKDLALMRLSIDY